MASLDVARVSIWSEYSVSAQPAAEPKKEDEPMTDGNEAPSANGVNAAPEVGGTAPMETETAPAEVHSQQFLWRCPPMSNAFYFVLPKHQLL